MLSPTAPTDHHGQPPGPPPELPTAPVLRSSRLNVTRTVVVACPYCSGEHEHLHPGNLGEPVGLRPAPCRPDAFYRPEWQDR